VYTGEEASPADPAVGLLAEAEAVLDRRDAERQAAALELEEARGLADLRAAELADLETRMQADCVGAGPSRATLHGPGSRGDTPHRSQRSDRGQRGDGKPEALSGGRHLPNHVALTTLDWI